jgi:flagellar basal-body rod protein FlgC
MPLSDTLHIAAAGMKAQDDRLRIIAENMANADSTSSVPGGEPYRRKTITFQNALNKELGIETVKVAKRGVDNTNFNKKYEPAHPAADEAGYVLYPNVSPIVEMIDMQEARRAYEANLNVVQVSKAMAAETIALLKQ